MADPVELLNVARSVLVVDWPSEEVPRTLARAGLRVFVHGGPGPDQYTEYVGNGDDVVARHVGRAPEAADLVYSYRPVEELPGIVAQAQALGARAVWTELPQEHERRARHVVEAAGLLHVNRPDIAETVRTVRGLP